MSLGDYKSMSKEPGGPADAPGHVGMSVEEIESENTRLRLLLVEAAFREGYKLGWSMGGTEISGYERGNGLTSDKEKKRLEDGDWQDSEALAALSK